MILLNQITSAVLQLLIFSGVPFVWYILTQKKVKGFFEWLGISTAAAPPLNAMFCSSTQSKRDAVRHLTKRHPFS